VSSLHLNLRMLAKQLRFFRHATNPKTLPMSRAFNCLHDLSSDVLLLLDCCHALPELIESNQEGVVAAIAASGYGPDALAALPGPSSFTTALTEVLARKYNHPGPVSDVMLHTEILARMRMMAPGLCTDADGNIIFDADGKPVFWSDQRNPVYAFLSRDRQSESIWLRPLPSDETNELAELGGNSSSTAPVQLEGEPGAISVLVQIMISENAGADEIANALAAIQGFNFKVVVAGRSMSTLLILRMPMEFWSIIPKHRCMKRLGILIGQDFADEVNSKLKMEQVKSVVSSPCKVDASQSDDMLRVVVTPERPMGHENHLAEPVTMPTLLGSLSRTESVPAISADLLGEAIGSPARTSGSIRGTPLGTPPDNQLLSSHMSEQSEIAKSPHMAVAHSLGAGTSVSHVNRTSPWYTAWKQGRLVLTWDCVSPPYGAVDMEY
jgi:hypothetical protein